ncbi:MAG: hypothetical protein SFY92_10530 [Verrucomicrobiae bacterium]|nr:hypothetical protein [Verrucomicrobiae bacterium]
MSRLPVIVSALTPRMTESAMRVVSYTVIIVFTSLGYQMDSVVMQGALGGAIFADFTTWMIKGLIQLPRYGLCLTFDSFVNALGGYMVFNMNGVHIPDHPDGLSVAFLVYLSVVAVKFVFYSVQAHLDSPL